jgi:uncharacterized protein YdeI (YjbR/CyaY-like superfamily)
MTGFSKQVDAYVAKSAPFAQPILEHLRELVHTACPDVVETIKWSFPHFDYKGMLCNMAAFKNHCSFGFWKGALMSDPNKVMTPVGRTSMGSFDRITSLDDLPSDKIMLAYIREAMKLNDENLKLPVKKTSTKKAAEVKVPAYFTQVLKKDKKAYATFTAFSPSHRKEYVEWITEAKTEETRKKRIETAIEWLSEGKSRHWKYVKK